MEEKRITPIKAIRTKCLDCCCNQPKEVNSCNSTNCSLYPFRFGKNPYRKEMSEERKEQSAKRMKEYHDKKKENQST